MSDKDLRTVSAATGQFPVLTASAKKADGSNQPADGKIVPVVEAPKPDLKKLAEKLNAASRSIGRDLRFEVDLNSGRSVIQVLDSETGEIIRQIPPEKAEVYLADGGKLALRLFDANV